MHARTVNIAEFHSGGFDYHPNRLRYRLSQADR
jgi:hypothetical protein